MVNKLRKAIYDACKATGVNTYDYWKRDAVMPYITINEVVEFENQYKLNDVNVFSVDIHYFEQANGKTATINILKAVKENLKELEGVNATYSTRTFNEKEPNIQHGVLNFSIKYYT